MLKICSDVEYSDDPDPSAQMMNLSDVPNHKLLPPDVTMVNLFGPQQSQIVVVVALSVAYTCEKKHVTLPAPSGGFYCCTPSSSAVGEPRCK